MLLKEKQKTERLIISHTDYLAYYIACTLMPANPSGFTLNPMTFQPPIFEDYNTEEIYLVSLRGYEEKFYCQPVFEEVAIWINKHNALLYCPGHYIGGWQDDHVYYLDISVAIRGEAKALRVAHENEQLAIYHPSSEKTIYVPHRLSLVA